LDIAPSARRATALAAGPRLAAAALVVDQGKRLEGRLHERSIFALQSIEPFAHCFCHPDLAIRIGGLLVVAGQFRRHRHHAPPGLLKTGTELATELWG